MKGLSATNPVRTVPVCTHSSDKDDLDLLLFQSIKVDWPGLRFNVSEHGKGISRLTSFGLYLYLRTIRSGDSQGCVYNCSLMMFDICSVPALFVQYFGPWVGNLSTNPLEIVPGLRMTRSEDYQGCVLLICSLVMFDCSVPAHSIYAHLRYFHYLARWFSGLRESLESILVQGQLRAGSTVISF